MLIAAVPFGVNFGRVGHEAARMEPVRLCDQRVMSCLSIVPALVAFCGELMMLGGGAMMFCGEQMSFGGFH